MYDLIKSRIWYSWYRYIPTYFSQHAWAYSYILICCSNMKIWFVEICYRDTIPHCYYFIDIFMISNLYYISCTYVKRMNCMVLGNKQYNYNIIILAERFISWKSYNLFQNSAFFNQGDTAFFLEIELPREYESVKVQPALTNMTLNISQYFDIDLLKAHTVICRLLASSFQWITPSGPRYQICHNAIMPNMILFMQTNSAD